MTGGLDGSLLLAAATAASAVAIVLLVALLRVSSRNRRLMAQLQLHAAAVGPAEALHEGAPPTLAQQDRWTLHAILLPRRPILFMLIACVVAMACWAVGLGQAPSLQRFLDSREWQIQPIYLTAHLIALRMFVRLFVEKYLAGTAQLAMPPDQIDRHMRRVLGPIGILLALVIALPFAYLDYLYLVSADYQRLWDDQRLHTIDYVLWGIWCTEWYINALIWVTLAGFLTSSYRALRTHRFRAPIATVLQEKRYRPFLQMSSQGASIILAFACVTALYMWVAGGETSDFVGLVVSGVMLVVGFVPLWFLMKAKVRRAVRDEIDALHRIKPARMAVPSQPSNAATDAHARTIDERLDEMLMLLRSWHLERLDVDLGRTEAKDLAVRLSAPAATAAWQFHSHLPSVLGQLSVFLKSSLNWLGLVFV